LVFVKPAVGLLYFLCCVKLSWILYDKHLEPGGRYSSRGTNTDKVQASVKPVVSVIASMAAWEYGIWLPITHFVSGSQCVAYISGL